MSKYLTTKQKLLKSWEKAEVNQLEVIRQKQENDAIFKQLKKLGQLDSVIQKIIDLSTDWTNLTILNTDTNGDAIDGWLNYKFTFFTLDESLVSILNPQFVRRFGVSEISNPNGTLLSGTSLTESYLYKLIEHENGLKEINANFTLTLENLGGLQDDIQFKLIFSVSNPNLYYKA